MLAVWHAVWPCARAREAVVGCCVEDFSSLRIAFFIYGFSVRCFRNNSATPTGDLDAGGLSWSWFLHITADTHDTHTPHTLRHTSTEHVLHDVLYTTVC